MKKLLLALVLLVVLAVPKAEAASKDWEQVLNVDNKLFVLVDLGDYEIKRAENGERVIKVLIGNYFAKTDDREQSAVLIETEVFENSLKYREKMAYYFQGDAKIGEQDHSGWGWRKHSEGTNGDTIMKRVVKAVLERERERNV